MTRFLIILSLLLSVYLVWCGAGIVLTGAHSGSEIKFPMHALESYDGDRNGPEYATLVQHNKEHMLNENKWRSTAYFGYAIKIACAAAIQFFVTLWLVGLRLFGKPVQKCEGGDLFL